MSYAINSTNTGWHAVNSKADLLPGETYSETQPIILTQIQAAQIDTLVAAYQTAIQQPVTFTTAGGITASFPADRDSRGDLQEALAIFGQGNSLPAGFHLVAVDGTQVPFTYKDLQGLAQVMWGQKWGAIQHLQDRKGKVNSAKNPADVNAVGW